MNWRLGRGIDQNADNIQYLQKAEVLSTQLETRKHVANVGSHCIVSMGVV